jgi:hypothetical protein
MIKSKAALFVASLTCFIGVSVATPTSVYAATCRYGGDESQSIRCFDCMKRVWTGKRWKIKYTCKSRYLNDFGSTAGQSR